MGGEYTKKGLLGEAVSALRALEKESGGYLRSVVINGTGSPLAEAAERTVRFPAVFVCYAGSEFSPGQYMGMTETVLIDVSALCGTGSAPDVLEVMDDLRARLCGLTMGGSARPLELVSEMPGPSTDRYVSMTARYRLVLNAGVALLDQST